MHVPLSKEEYQLLFGKVDVDVSKWHHVEGQIPTGILQSTYIILSFILLAIIYYMI